MQQTQILSNKELKLVCMWLKCIVFKDPFHVTRYKINRLMSGNTFKLSQGWTLSLFNV